MDLDSTVTKYYSFLLFRNEKVCQTKYEKKIKMTKKFVNPFVLIGMI